MCLEVSKFLYIYSLDQLTDEIVTWLITEVEMHRIRSYVDSFEF